MLMLLFCVGNNRYGLEISQVVEIIPRVMLRKLNQAPEYIAGVFNYRGMIVPVIDLCNLIQSYPCPSALSNRIIMVNYLGKEGCRQIIGLMAERVTETLERPDSQLIGTEFGINNVPYLGQISSDERGMIQSLRLDYLLSDLQVTCLLPAQED